MVLDDYRKKADPYLTPLARYFIDTHPNTMTWLAFLFAVITGIIFYLTNFLGGYASFLLIPCSVFIFLNALFDALDGKVARLSKKASIKGDFLDHVLDRYADVFIIGGMMVSPYCDFRIGLLAILGVIFASYMGTQAQAVGIKRQYSGILGRADRLVLLILAPIIQLVLEIARIVDEGHRFHISVGDATVKISIIEFLMIWFAIAGHATAVQRAHNTWIELEKKEGDEE